MSDHKLLNLRRTRLHFYNSLGGKKSEFKEITANHVGIYLCGPTVYGDPHLGHSRPAITIDVLVRYLLSLNYKVRYVRNITDVGHLENDADQGEDKIAKKARLEQLEPMEVAQTYTRSYRSAISKLNTLPPSIEPQATGHIIEQIALTQKILDANFAYVTDGNVYFDVIAYSKKYPYGELSGRVLDDLLAGTRDLDGQEEKRNPADFALWKKASPEHIMKWPSPWGEGFPGWHIECSAMSTKYLGQKFDIHGGGMDLLFPHHESEIAQSVAGLGCHPANYWIHNNMVTINGQKMGKSLGNFITLDELFNGTHPLLEQPYSPMAIRFFMLQAHYRSTLDFSNEALKAASKGYRRIINGLHLLDKLPTENLGKGEINKQWETEIESDLAQSFAALDDDLNTAIVVANLFNLLKKINGFYNKPETLENLSVEAWYFLAKGYRYFASDILGLSEENSTDTHLLQSVLEIYAEAKNAKDYPKIDAIRNSLKNSGIQIRDRKEGIDWGYAE